MKAGVSVTKNFQIINEPSIPRVFNASFFDKNENTNSTRVRFIVADPQNVDKETGKWNSIVNLTNIRFEYKTPTGITNKGSRSIAQVKIVFVIF